MQCDDLQATHAWRPGRLVRSRLRSVRAVIVDLDGTMVDTAPEFHMAVNGLCDDYGLPRWPLQAIIDCIGKGPENLVRQVLGATLDAARVEASLGPAIACFQRHYALGNGAHAQLYPGVLEGLGAMREAGLLLACVTNKPHKLATELLAKKDLARFFSYVYGGDSLPFKKPHAYPVLRVCSDFALAPAQVVLIGDSSNDAEAARAAGCLSLCVPYGYNHGQPIGSAGADAVVTDLHAAAIMLLS